MILHVVEEKRLGSEQGVAFSRMGSGEVAGLSLEWGLTWGQ